MTLTFCIKEEIVVNMPKNFPLMTRDTVITKHYSVSMITLSCLHHSHIEINSTHTYKFTTFLVLLNKQWTNFDK